MFNCNKRKQGDKLHIKLSLALLITALQQKCMPGVSEGFNYTQYNQLPFQMEEAKEKNREGNNLHIRIIRT